MRFVGAGLTPENVVISRRCGGLVVRMTVDCGKSTAKVRVRVSLVEQRPSSFFPPQTIALSLSRRNFVVLD